MKTLAFDLDGVVERERRLPRWLPEIFFRLVTLITLPVAGATDALRFLVKRYRIIVVTKRPPWTERETRWWLGLHAVSYHRLFLVARNDEKAGTLIREGAALYFDDKKHVVEALRKQGIKAFLFTNWGKVFETIKKEE